MSENNKNAVKTVSFMMIITLAGKILGLLRDMFLGHNFGTGMESSAFLTASQIPRIFFDAVFASAISSSFIPIFNEYMEKKGKKEAFKLSNNFITLICIFTFILTALGMVFARPLTWLFADGFDVQTAELCAVLLRMLFPTVIFTGIAFSLVGILQSMDEFGVPAAMSIVSNGVIILYYIFFKDKFGIYGLTVAFIIGWAMQAVIQIPPLFKRGYIYKPYINFHDEGLKKIFMLMLPVMVSTWIQPINLSISIKFASRLFGGDGSGVSAINYANTLYTIIVGVFVLSVANVIFPNLSRLVTNNKDSEFNLLITSTIKILMFLLVPMTIGLMILSTPIIRLIYEWKDWDTYSTVITSRALFFFSIGMIGFGIQNILSRAFYAAKDGRTPLITGAVSIVLNAVLCMALTKNFDVAGLAAASSISSLVSAVLLIIPMQKKNKNFITKSFMANLAKIVLCTIVMGVIVIISRNFIVNSFNDGIAARILAVGVPSVFGVSVYMFLTWILGIEESKTAFSMILKIFSKLKGGLAK